MRPDNTNLLDIPTIQHKARELARLLGREDFSIADGPAGDATPHIEVNDAYYYVVDERGHENKRLRTTDIDELLYWIMGDMTFWMSWDYERHNRRHGEDSRRLAFAKDVELLASLSESWARRRKAEQEDTLRGAPFRDR
jgi:hypothetical protein